MIQSSHRFGLAVSSRHICLNPVWQLASDQTCWLDWIMKCDGDHHHHYDTSVRLIEWLSRNKSISCGMTLVDFMMTQLQFSTPTFWGLWIKNPEMEGSLLPNQTEVDVTNGHNIIAGGITLCFSLFIFCLYIPCLKIMATDQEMSRNPCYKIMLNMGIADLIQQSIAGVCGGIFTIVQSTGKELIVYEVRHPAYLDIGVRLHVSTLHSCCNVSCIAHWVTNLGVIIGTKLYYYR